MHTVSTIYIPKRVGLHLGNRDTYVEIRAVTTKSYLQPDGFEFAVLEMTYNDLDVIIKRSSQEPSILKKWLASWYGMKGVGPLFPKPHPSEIVEAKLQKHSLTKTAEWFLKIQRGHYILASTFISDQMPISPDSVALWPKEL